MASQSSNPGKMSTLDTVVLVASCLLLFLVASCFYLIECEPLYNCHVFLLAFVVSGLVLGMILGLAIFYKQRG